MQITDYLQHFYTILLFLKWYHWNYIKIHCSQREPQKKKKKVSCIFCTMISFLTKVRSCHLRLFASRIEVTACLSYKPVLTCTCIASGTHTFLRGCEICSHVFFCYIFFVRVSLALPMGDFASCLFISFWGLWYIWNELGLCSKIVSISVLFSCLSSHCSYNDW